MLQAHRQAKVLIVDDYSETALLLLRLLARHCLERLHLARIPARWSATSLPELTPDLVLLDLYTPGVDGCTMLRHVREWAGKEYLPVVVLASDVRPEMLRRAVNDGATDFLTKPFSATEILLRVRNVLRARSLYLAVEALAVQDLDRSRLMSGRS